MVQYAAEANSIPHLNTLGIKQVQGIVSSLLYYVWSANNNLLVYLSAIGDQQASATTLKLDAIT